MKKTFLLLLSLALCLAMLVGCQTKKPSNPSASSSSSVPSGDTPQASPDEIHIPQISDATLYGDHGILNVTAPTYGDDNPGADFSESLRYGVEYISNTVPQSRTYELNGETLELTYVKSIYYALIDRHTHQYKIEGKSAYFDENEDIHLMLYDDGSLYRIQGYVMEEIPDFRERSDEQMRTLLEVAFDEIIDFDYFSHFEKFILNENMYEYTWSREMNGYTVYDFIRITVVNGRVAVAVLLPPIELPETLDFSESDVTESVEAHFSEYYTAKDKKVFEHNRQNTYIVRYGGVLCLYMTEAVSVGDLTDAEADYSKLHDLLVTIPDHPLSDD